MAEAGFHFETFTNDVDESFPDELPVNQVAKFLAEKKSRHYQQLISDKIILTADTTVVVDHLLLNKPENEVEAIKMLKMLSGRKHLVVTGVAIAFNNEMISFDDTTEITFRALDDEEIVDYVQNYRPYDKAGAYGAQEKIGHIAIASITGSFYNVAGLPIHKVYEHLKNFKA